MARADDFSLVRLAEFGTDSTASQSPTERMLRGLAGMWTDSDAVQLETNFTNDRTKTWTPARGWRGAGGPQTLRQYKGVAGGEGQNRVTNRYNARPVTIPLAESNANKAEKEKLRGLMWPDEVFVGAAGSRVPMQGLLAAGLRPDTGDGNEATDTANARYLLDVSDEGSFEMPQRGHKAYSVSPLKLRSTWPWYVRPQTAADNTIFTPGGDGPKIIWGVYWASGSIGDITVEVTIGGATTESRFRVSGSLDTPFFCFSPPFREAAGNLVPTNRVRPYLIKGQSTRIDVSPAGATIFYFENYGSA